MKGIRIGLTEFQQEMLEPYFKELRESNKSGRPGGLFAQVWKGENGSTGFLDVRLVDHDMCKEIQRVSGVKSGTMSSGKLVDVYVPDCREIHELYSDKDALCPVCDKPINEDF